MLLISIFIILFLVVSAGGEYIISPPVLTTSAIASPIIGIKTSSVNKHCQLTEGITEYNCHTRTRRCNLYIFFN